MKKKTKKESDDFPEFMTPNAGEIQSGDDMDLTLGNLYERQRVARPLSVQLTLNNHIGRKPYTLSVIVHTGTARTVPSRKLAQKIALEVVPEQEVNFLGVVWSYC